MAVFRITWNQAEINRIGLQAARLTVTDTGRRVLNRAIVLTPVRTGYLRSHNRMRVSERGLIATTEVFDDASYARPVHDGSRAYTIRPKKKKALRFEVGGEVVIVKSVRMPARKGRPWLLRALIEVATPEGYTITRLG